VIGIPSRSMSLSSSASPVIQSTHLPIYMKSVMINFANMVSMTSRDRLILCSFRWFEAWKTCSSARRWRCGTVSSAFSQFLVSATTSIPPLLCRQDENFAGQKRGITIGL
jgi:hypothetical protein